jgi:hypothetical protein
MSSSESENSASEVDDSEVEIHSQSSESDQSDQSDSVSEEDDFGSFDLFSTAIQVHRPFSSRYFSH